MTKRRTSAKLDSSEVPSTKPLIEISEEEQWRLIHDTGILHKVSDVTNSEAAATDTQGREALDLGDEIFNATLLIIPFSFLLLLMEILTHRQYKQEPTLQDLLDRMLPGVPILSLAIFYGKRYRSVQRFQLLLFILSIIFGARLIWIVNHANWKVNLKQCPPLATAWVLAITALDLGPSVMSLVVIGVWSWWAGMKLAW